MMRRGVQRGGLCHGSRETVPASSRLRAFLMTKGGLWFVDEWPHVVVLCKTPKATDSTTLFYFRDDFLKSDSN